MEFWLTNATQFIVCSLVKPRFKFAQQRKFMESYYYISYEADVKVALSMVRCWGFGACQICGPQSPTCALNMNKESGSLQNKVMVFESTSTLFVIPRAL